MTQSEWNELEIGQIVFSFKNSDCVLGVVEICMEERYLSKWSIQGIERIIKLEDKDGYYHTWAGNWDDWCAR